MHYVQTCNLNFQSGIKDKNFSNMGMCSCVTDLSRQKKASVFLCLWAGIGGIVALILNDENACVELRQMMMVTCIGLSVLFFWGERVSFSIALHLVFCGVNGCDLDLYNLCLWK